LSAGASCASSADCCNGAPCVPNPGGNPPFVCSPNVCISACGACSTTADCCPGTSCDLPAGSTHGTCGPCGGGGPDGGAGGPDGGSGGPDGGSGPGDGGVPQDDAGCAFYGQVCTTSADCCGGIPCTNGRCQEVIQ
jgi:hypothetical protein